MTDRDRHVQAAIHPHVHTAAAVPMTGSSGPRCCRSWPTMAAIALMALMVGYFTFELARSLSGLQEDLPRFGLSVTMEMNTVKTDTAELTRALDFLYRSGPERAAIERLVEAGENFRARLHADRSAWLAERVPGYPQWRAEASGLSDLVEEFIVAGNFSDSSRVWGLAESAGWLMVRSESIYRSFGDIFDSELLAQQKQIGYVRDLLVSVIALLVTVAAAAAFVIFHRERVLERQQQAEQLLAEERTRLIEAIESLNDGFVLFDRDDRLALCNQQYRNLYPRSAAFMQPGISFRELIERGIEAGEYDGGADDPKAYLEERVASHARADGRVLEQKLVDGRVIRVSERRTADGGIVGTRSDISEIRQREEALATSERRYRFLASYDMLTGLGNRAFFNDTVECMLETSPGEDFRTIILLIDLDGFKEINDAFGHKTGDEVLKVVANRLLSSLPDGGMAARIGADQFAVAVSSFGDVDIFRRLAEVVMRIFADTIVINDQHLSVRATIGIAAHPDHADTADDLLSRADLALYRAKQVGRGSWMIYDPEIARLRARRRDLELSIKRALRDREFDLALQPKLSLEDGEVHGVEALLRWYDPVKGEHVSPGEFIPVAESSHLIIDIDRHVIREGCRKAMAFHREHGIDLAIAVNLSGAHFHRSQLVGLVEDALESSGLPPHLLEVELTEGVLVRDRRSSEAIIGRLHDLGVRISLDDFGTGYSSLAYLRDLPLDRLKIDRSFVMKIEKSARDRSIVRTFVNLSRELGMKVIGEGVETVEQIRYLRDIGCDEIQGYFISRPLQGDDFGTWMKNRSWLPLLERMNEDRSLMM